MVTIREKLMYSMKRVELDTQQVYPWSESIAPLFNDPYFWTEPILVLAGGVMREEIRSTNPALRTHVRYGVIRKRKFTEIKSLFGTYVTRYEASVQGDPEAFAIYADGKICIMYAICFVQAHSSLKLLCTRALRIDFLQEAGVGLEVSQYGFGSPGV